MNKFRAWNSKASCMMQPSDFWISADGHAAGFNDLGHIEFTHWDLMQYTSITDKNGVEIYEGDVADDHNGRGVVEYVQEKAAFRLNYFDNNLAKWFLDYNLRGERESIDVIGNKYENPELLITDKEN